MCYLLLQKIWAINSVVRVLSSHGRSPQFKSGIAHQADPVEHMSRPNEHPRTIHLPPGAWEDFLGAVEAASGEKQRAVWRDPMSPEQILDAFNRTLLARRPDRGLEVLSRSGLLEPVLPEVHAMVGFGEGVRHKDVWAHTKQVVKQAPARLVVRWAALLHDIGKVPTRRFEPGGQVTFIGHPEVGARMFRRVARRLPFSKRVVDRLSFLIAGHLRAAAYEESWTDSAVRRFARDAGENLNDLLDLSRADITSKYVEKVRHGLRQINRLEERIIAVREEDARPAPLPKGLGTAILERFDIAPGPGLGRLMDALKAAVEGGELQVQGEFEVYLRYVEEHPELLSLA